MTLLVLAEPSDETAARFADFAGGRGVETVMAAGFDRVSVTVTVTRDLHSRCAILVDGRPATGIFCRGWLGSSPLLSSAARFAASEQHAALWSAVALWPGPVINRPSEHGYPPRLDSLELAASSPGIRPSGIITNAHGAPGNYAYRISDWKQLDVATRAFHDVVHIAEVDESRIHRLLIAGTRTFDVSDPGRRLDFARRSAHIDLIRRWLQGKLADFAIVTVDASDAADGKLRLLEASPWANHSQFKSVEEQTYRALLERLGR